MRPAKTFLKTNLLYNRLRLTDASALSDAKLAKSYSSSSLLVSINLVSATGAEKLLISLILGSSVLITSLIVSSGISSPKSSILLLKFL